MWRCANCGAEGFEPVWKTENLGFAEHPYYEDEAHCPHCGSENVEDAEAIRKENIDLAVYQEKCRLLSGTPSETSVSITEKWAATEPPGEEYYEGQKWYSAYKKDFVDTLAKHYGVTEGGRPYDIEQGKFAVSIEHIECSQIKNYTFCNLDYTTFKDIFRDMSKAYFFPTMYYKGKGRTKVLSNCSLGNLRMSDLIWLGFETKEGLANELAELGFDEAKFRKEKKEVI